MIASSLLVSLYKSLLVGTFLLSFSEPAFAFLPQASLDRTVSIVLSSSSSSSSNENNQVGRRDALQFVASTAALGLNLALTTTAVHAEGSPSTTSKVVVAGATGQTGRRILERLASIGSLEVVGGVRNVDKATASLGESSVVIRGAMVQSVPDSVDEIATSLMGAESLIIATGFIPGSPLKMKSAAHEVDNLGTIKLIDAAKKTGTVKKIVMVSSILTNGRNWGQEKSPGFIITNAFGSVLDEKLVAEQYLKASGMNYSIIRPGGLKSKPPTGALQISSEDTLNSGEISRDLVADVCVASLTDPKANNKVLEIIEDEGVPPKVFNGMNM
ncbi:NAD(P)-binding protein [Fragilariopsis cylindrus CCMP1102]|uniref:NAD(P)-binding protein n=1 Tax=Fragilariopsis cylindrus CCMP1102 TaxID=635003 RepID=A0A1E7ESV2_9STRA|nr:NAD(P)-binding protein [Fragilariopsis cylindrus CCMP1102]|eukprot:OEU08925.1 NAD(P)-binding protein [Fragilariopsis cylindrus CCMP1102]